MPSSTTRAALPDRLPALAILDWGIGGTGLAAALVATHPRAAFVYVSDAGFTPYGKVPAHALARRLRAIAAALAERGVEHLVLACNAASTVADAVRAAGTLTVTDVVTHGVALVVSSPARRIGVVGGARTIRSGIFRRALVAAGRDVVQRVAQPLSARVEAGELSGAAVEADVARVVAPLRTADALLLACTHYPALAPVFRAQLPGVTLLDPVERLATALRDAGLRDGARVVLTTGDADATRRSAARAFGWDPGSVRAVAPSVFDEAPQGFVVRR